MVRACASHTGAPPPAQGGRAAQAGVATSPAKPSGAIFDGGDSFSKSVSQPSPNANPPGERSAAGVPIVGDAPIEAQQRPEAAQDHRDAGGEERREGFGLRGAYASEAYAPSEKKDDQKIIHSSVAAGTRAEATRGGAFAQTSTAANTFLATADASPGDTNASLQSDAQKSGLFRQEVLRGAETRGRGLRARRREAGAERRDLAAFTRKGARVCGRRASPRRSPPSSPPRGSRRTGRTAG